MHLNLYHHFSLLLVFAVQLFLLFSNSALALYDFLILVAIACPIVGSVAHHLVLCWLGAAHLAAAGTFSSAGLIILHMYLQQLWTPKLVIKSKASDITVALSITPDRIRI